MSSSGMIENFCDMVAYAKLPKSIADQAFETYFPKDIFDRYNNYMPPPSVKIAGKSLNGNVGKCWCAWKELRIKRKC